MITRKQETGMVVIVGVIILLLLLLTSCGSKKTITEYVAVHDTTYISRSDTIRDYRVVRDTVVDWKVITTHDTLHHEKERVIVLNEKGDTISQREWERLWQKIHDLQSSFQRESHTDSAAYLKAQNDSLRAVLRAQESKEETKRTTIPKTWEYGLLALFCLVFFNVVAWAASLWKKK